MLAVSPYALLLHFRDAALSRTVCIHQPNYLPWIGFFSKIRSADCFIIFDIVQYTSHGVINRNKIRTRTGSVYLTIPVPRAFHNELILNVPLPRDSRWKKDHWQTLQTNYAAAPFFGEYKDFFKLIYQEDFPYLWQFNEKILRYLLDCFAIKVEIHKASHLDIDPALHKTDLIIACLKNTAADAYLSGPSGSQYLEREKFQENHIRLQYFSFRHPVYRQRYPGFEPNLSAVDLLFNTGPGAGRILAASGEVLPPIS